MWWWSLIGPPTLWSKGPGPYCFWGSTDNIFPAWSVSLLISCLPVSQAILWIQYQTTAQRPMAFTIEACMHDDYWCGLSWKPVCKTCSVCQDMLAECKASFYQLAGALEQTTGHVQVSVQCAVWSVCRHGCRQFVDGGTLRAGPPASVGFNSCEDVKSKKKEPIVLWLIWAFVVWIHIWNMLLFLINHAITQTNLYTPAEINWVYAVSLLLLLLQAKIFWTGKCTICWIGPCLSCLTLWQMHSVLEQCNIYM